MFSSFVLYIKTAHGNLRLFFSSLLYPNLKMKSIRDSLTNDANRGFLEILLAKMGTSMEKLYEMISIITASNP